MTLGKTLSKILGTTFLALAGGAMLLSTVSAEARGPGGGERPTFEQLDTDGDGQVTLEELQARGAARFAQTDTDGNGELSRDELLATASERAESRVDRMLEHADTDGNGAISEAEMDAARAERQGRRGGADRAARMFERADANGDGAISAEEFAELGARRGGARGGDVQTQAQPEAD